MTRIGQKWPSTICLLLCLISSLTGCRNTTDTVEMALRAREQDMRVLKEELARVEACNDALNKELYAVRHQGSWQGGGPVITPEYAANTYTLKRITLGRGTGGYEEDKFAGEKSLQVVIEPRDLADDLIKAPGSAQVTALEVSPEGIKTVFSSWDVSATQMSKNWKQGLFNTGYVLVLPWQQPPKTKQVRVVVRFKLSDGRLFEADKDITVKPGPQVVPSPKSSNLVDPVWPGQSEMLPLPQQFKPAAALTPPQAEPSEIQPAGNWQPASLNGAVKMLAPVPLYSAPTEAVETEY